MFFGKKTDANTSKTLSLISSTFKMASEKWKNSIIWKWNLAGPANQIDYLNFTNYSVEKSQTCNYFQTFWRWKNF